MQGNIHTIFKGKKKDLEKLLGLFYKEALSGDYKEMFGLILDLILVPVDLSLLNHDEWEAIIVNYEGFSEIDWFNDAIFFSIVVNEVPEITFNAEIQTSTCSSHYYLPINSKKYEYAFVPVKPKLIRNNFS